jgi:hypothetical protein
MPSDVGWVSRDDIATFHPLTCAVSTTLIRVVVFKRPGTSSTPAFFRFYTLGCGLSIASGSTSAGVIPGPHFYALGAGRSGFHGPRSPTYCPAKRRFYAFAPDCSSGLEARTHSARRLDRVSMPLVAGWSLQGDGYLLLRQLKWFYALMAGRSLR